MFHLHHLHDINGAYGAGTASATAVVGQGATVLRNGAGVQINLHMDSQGLQATSTSRRKASTSNWNRFSSPAGEGDREAVEGIRSSTGG